ncbi:lipid II flippase MurJ [Ramlibacter sp.]|uniref:lipid II flippase MurJ n=1 Tax=Ramlibacter sp. TaxID=1917967 RepID=UPI002BFDF1A9|nr:lipid II flippase MurJ [Ramlibacter sp.]HWI81347.1 lipid II flippase MurJ [Ramlibacter sp.]
MFLKAGALSLALLLASRLLGLGRESALAAAFGTSGLADVAVLMLTLPDWVAGVLASGALAYVLVPAWAGQAAGQVHATERRVATRLVGAGVLLGVLLVLWRQPALHWLAAGLPPALRGAGAQALVWSAIALPAALLAAVWTTRLQHEQDFTGMYSANLVVNALLIGAIALTAAAPRQSAVGWLGGGLLVAMLARLAWLRWRARPAEPRRQAPAAAPALPRTSVWLWAALSAGLPLALPFAARSIASQGGAGALATFNYAWKLVELPLMLAIQVVATLALPAIARALAGPDLAAARAAVRSAFALAWALACGAAAALLVGAPAIAGLLFGWGRMEPAALARVAQWGTLGAWSLLPQALIAVTLAVLAARGRLKPAVLGYALALALLLLAGGSGWSDGAALMLLLDALFAIVAVVAVAAVGAQVRAWLPWRAMAISLGALLAVAVLTHSLASFAGAGVWPGLAAAAAAGLLVLAMTWWGSADLRTALAR